MDLNVGAACEHELENNIERVKTWGSNPGHVPYQQPCLPLSHFKRVGYIIINKHYKRKESQGPPTRAKFELAYHILPRGRLLHYS